MVSKKKKGRGKAKKVTKKAEEKQEAAANEQQGTPDGQMQRLKIEDSSQDEDALLEEAIKLAAAENEALEASAAEQEETSQKLAEKHSDGCSHEYATTENHFIIEDFANTFISGFVSVGCHILNRLGAAEEATREKYPEVWGDSSKLKQVVSLFIANGTQKVLNGDINGARTFAFLSCHLQNYIAVWLHERIKATLDMTKIIELAKADEHTLVKYLKKNIPCNCLDEKYKEVKSVTKMGFCCNEHCQVPDRMVERRTMLYCTRCRGANYCSPECQKADWPSHKEDCDEFVEDKAKFNSKQKNN